LKLSLLVEGLKMVAKKPGLIFPFPKFLGSRGFFHNMNDEAYLKRSFKAEMGYELDLENPRTFNEKLQWLKLYDRNPEYTLMADKYAVRQFVSERIGKDYLIPLLGVWDSFNEIDFDKLPDRFVLKTTHDSGTVMLCKEKESFNVEHAKKKLTKSLNRNFYYGGREWVYKDITPRIIAEEFMVDESGTELKDYKFFCFDGEPKGLFVATDRSVHETKFDFFDIEFNHLGIVQGYPNSDKSITKPIGLEEMKKIAKTLSRNIPHVRVDLYDVNGRIFFGEMTFFHFCGYVPFEPDEWDLKFGEYITLPEKKT
jgi:hypothetical protein